MRSRTARVSLAVAALVMGCTREQAWTFHNGAGLEEPPFELLAEIYDSPECGFGCEPPGEPVYCEVLARGERGPAPVDLVEGRSYCFIGTAINETNEAYAIGCAVAEIGGDPIDIPLSRLEDRVSVTRRCSQPMVMFDAGPPLDAGPARWDAGRLDSGPEPLDAGPAVPDAGPGLPPGTRITVRFQVFGPGTVRLVGPGLDETFSRGWLDLFAQSGYSLRIESYPDSGARLAGITGSCGTANPCTIVLDRPETIDITFTAR